MDSLLAHHTFENNILDSQGKNLAKIIGKPLYDKKYGKGIRCDTDNDVIMLQNEISLAGLDYSICCWFEYPFPEGFSYHTLTRGKDLDHQVLVRSSDLHLGVYDNATDTFWSSGYSLSNLSKGLYHLVAIGDNSKKITRFYINNELVETSNFKSNSGITFLGNFINNSQSKQQPWGFLADLRIYNKQLNSEERDEIFNLFIDKKIVNNFDKNYRSVKNVIELSHISKTFRIYHERRNSLFEYLTSFFNRKNSYEKIKVLDDVSFSITKGEMIGILGLNGSGKTTLLKIISKIYVPDNGIVKTTGKITPLLGIGGGFNDELSGKDNIILYGVILGFSKKEMIKKINHIIKFAELEKFLDVKLKNYSTGMRARLAFSTAMEVDPNILLVDEVLSVGDIGFQEKSFRTFMEFKKRGKTIIFVSHDINQIQNLCDKVVWLDKGVFRMYGDPTDVVNSYKEFSKQKN